MFCQMYVIMWSFAKNMELCEVLPKIWNYVKFCRKYGVMPSFVKNMELYEVSPKNKVMC